MHGFFRLAAATPMVRVADVQTNVARVRELLSQADADGVALCVFPELCVTGYTCADLFHQSRLLAAAEAAVLELAAATAGSAMVTVIGAPLMVAGRLYNCGVVLQDGAVLGVVPKSYLPNYKEFYEKRWFATGLDVAPGSTLPLGGVAVPFGTDLLFDGGAEFRLGVEVCEDLWNVIPPSSMQALAGATLCANPSASDELVAKSGYRRDLVAGQSARCVSGYVYASSGVSESSTDVVYGGHSLIAENGTVLAEGERFRRTPGMVTADVDCRRLTMTRLTETSFASNAMPAAVRWVALRQGPRAVTALRRRVDPRPFVPGDPARRDARCEEIFHIQATGLANRLAHIGTRKTVIGISGGLDSTLALLVTREAWRLLGHDASRIVTITMPGYGTTDRTYENAVSLCNQLGTELREVNIVPACEQHFRDIGHDPSVHDVTYENVQARERTQILMDVANREGGIVVGTGDLSEIALGWSTYNGDHMSMYAVNCGVPKTLIRYVIEWVADHGAADLRATLLDVLDTPISPELLPKSADGAMLQMTEDTIGPYELHDFFLYHAVKYGAEPDKIAWLAGVAFADKYEPATIHKWLVLFVKRFFNNQFKRSCIPDGPKVGSIALSPRGDWRMPSDAASALWLAALEGDAAAGAGEAAAGTGDAKPKTGGGQ